MKTLLILVGVFFATAAVMAVQAMVVSRYVRSTFLTALVFGLASTLIVGSGFRVLPAHRLLPVIGLGLAWGFGFCLPLALVVLRLRRLATVSRQAASQPPESPGGRER